MLLFWYFCTFSCCYHFSIRRESLLCRSRRWSRLLYTLSSIAQFIRAAVAGSSVKSLKCECGIATGINALSEWLFWQAPGMDANKWDFRFIRWIFVFSFCLALKKSLVHCCKPDSCWCSELFFLLYLTKESNLDLQLISFSFVCGSDSSGLNSILFFFVNPYLDYEGFQWALNAQYKL